MSDNGYYVRLPYSPSIQPHTTDYTPKHPTAPPNAPPHYTTCGSMVRLVHSTTPLPLHTWTTASTNYSPSLKQPGSPASPNHHHPARKDAENSPEPSKNKEPGTSPSATSLPADDSTPSPTTPETRTSATSAQDHQNLVHALELEKQRAHYAEQQLHQAQQLIQAKQDTIEALKTTIHALEITPQKQLTVQEVTPRPRNRAQEPTNNRHSPLLRLSQWLEK